VEIRGCILGKDMCDVWWIRQHRDELLLVYVGTIAIFQVVGSRSTTIADINELPAAELINPLNAELNPICHLLILSGD
jgi:hypothetical protein